jgi:hypothetical protein
MLMNFDPSPCRMARDQNLQTNIISRPILNRMKQYCRVLIRVKPRIENLVFISVREIERVGSLKYQSKQEIHKKLTKIN